MTENAPQRDVSAPEAVAASAPRAAASTSMGGLGTVGVVLYIVATLAAIAAVVAGIILIVHKGQDCVPNPYNDALGTDLEDCSTTHPFQGAGWGVMVGGLIQAFGLFVVAYLCVTVDRLRRPGVQ